MRHLFGRILAALTLIACLATAAPAQEAERPTLPAPLTEETVDALVSWLSDPKVREFLLSEANTPTEGLPQEAAPPKSGLINGLATLLGQISTRVAKAVSGSPGQTKEVITAIGEYAQSLGTAGLVRLLGSIAAALALGWAVSAIFGRRISAALAERGIVTVDAAVVPAFPASIPLLARRFFRDTSGALLAFVFAAILLAIALPERETRVALAVVVWLIFVPLLLRELLRFFLSPQRPELRLVDLNDDAARFLVRWLVGTAVVFGIGETVLRVAEEIGGPTLVHGAGFWFSTLVYVLLMYIVLRARDALRQLVGARGDAETGRKSLMVRFYPTFCVVAIVGTWAFGTITWAMEDKAVTHQARHLVGLILALVAPMCDALIRSIVRILVPPPPGKGPVADAAHLGTIEGSIRIARVVVLGSLVLIIAQLWQIPLLGFASSGFGQDLAVRLIGAMMILLGGYVVIEFIGLLVNRRLARESGGEDTLVDATELETGPTGGSAHSRLGTVLPPVGLTARIAVAVITVLMALSHLGVNTTPLLAGAGVLGIAIGFGAQKLVADVVSGIFFLIEDAFRTNEYINAGGIEGTVERISIRSLHLRQSDGALHCIPYSNVSQITNFGRDWGTMKQVFTVPFDTSIDKVRKIFKRIGQDLAADPNLKDAFIQPFKFKGVSQVNDIGIVVRGKFMFKPEAGKQYLINREIYKRVQADFAAAGIPFARREVHVVMDGSNDAERAAAQAAAATS